MFKKYIPFYVILTIVVVAIVGIGFLKTPSQDDQDSVVIVYGIRDDGVLLTNCKSNETAFFKGWVADSIVNKGYEFGDTLCYSFSKKNDIKIFDPCK